jgi:hypothetical protein
VNGGIRTIKTLIVAATVISSLAVPAYSDPFSKGGRGASGPPVEEHPKVDEKAYKAALDRIPTPNQKYDPWGIARPPEPAGVARKSNYDRDKVRRKVGHILASRSGP